MELLIDSQGEPVTPGLYKIKTSESLMGLLLDFSYKWRLNNLFDNCMANAYHGDVVLCPHHHQHCEVLKFSLPVLNDMFRISPANEASHLNLLSYIGSRDFGTVL